MLRFGSLFVAMMNEHEPFFVCHHPSITCAPSSVTLKNLASHLSIPPFSLNVLITSSAILILAPRRQRQDRRPAPLRQIPNSPGCVFGVTLASTSFNPGINPFLYGWWTLSCIAW